MYNTAKAFQSGSKNTVTSFAAIPQNPPSYFAPLTENTYQHQEDELMEVIQPEEKKSTMTDAFGEAAKKQLQPVKT